MAGLQPANAIRETCLRVRTRAENPASKKALLATFSDAAGRGRSSEIHAANAVWVAGLDRITISSGLQSQSGTWHLAFGNQHTALCIQYSGFRQLARDITAKSVSLAKSAAIH
jgi:hypothetical protein